MPAPFAELPSWAHATFFALFFLFPLPALSGQRATNTATGAPSSAAMSNVNADLEVAVRDAHGFPLEAQAIVRLTSVIANFHDTQTTQSSSKAHFSAVPQGDYEVEVTSPGYRKSLEHFLFMGNHVSLPIYVYLVPEGEPASSAGPPTSATLSLQLRGVMEKGFEALKKEQYEAARKIFTKALQKAPGNPDVVYFLGVAELGLQHIDLAREDFQRTLALEPNHELALVSLGHLQLRTGATADAISLLQKAVALGRASWRAHYELATAYFKVNRYADAQFEASHAARLAKENGANATYLLAQIQYAEGHQEEAKRTLSSIPVNYPQDPIVPEIKKVLARLEGGAPQVGLASSETLSPPAPSAGGGANVIERPWAPPDIDAAVYDVAPGVNCKAGPILDGALYQLNSQLIDFEKFTATEHIEHQQIDRYGLPGPMQTRDFTYIVFVHPFANNSVYLQESRDAGADVSTFPAIVTTTGLNNLGVSVLQPAYRERFAYTCEGLTNVRGQGAWQVRFEDKPGANGQSVRRWHKGMTTYEVAIKGRIWISSLSYAVLRIESDLRDPVAGLGLTKDHILVDYGPVQFSTGNVQLWLPWSADMYLELGGKRYHHRHFLSDYMLFGVDTTHKIENPKELPPPPSESSP
jgi:tetratricopeptide (TPR) repeat protein